MIPLLGMIVDELLTFRDRIRRASPPWLQRGLAEKILYSIGVHIDLLGDVTAAGVKLRFPGLYSNESLALIGRERRITRGQSEESPAYAARLRRWLLDHRRRGNPYAMLGQLYYHYTPNTFDIDLVNQNGRRFSLAADAVVDGVDVDDVIERDLVTWQPDGNIGMWCRWWLFFYTDLWDVTPPTAAELQDLKLIPRQWNAAHPLAAIILFPSTAELWNWPPGHTWNETGIWNTTGTARYIDVDSP